MKSLVILLCMLSISPPSFAENLVLLRKDKEHTSYYESDTIRRTQQLVMVWAVTKKDGKKHSEYLTEFDCKSGVYRQLSLRVFDSESKVTSGDAVYREWFNVPSTTQVVGILFSKICINNLKVLIDQKCSGVGPNQLTEIIKENYQNRLQLHS